MCIHGQLDTDLHARRNLPPKIVPLADHLDTLQKRLGELRRQLLSKDRKLVRVGHRL